MEILNTSISTTVSDLCFLLILIFGAALVFLDIVTVSWEIHPVLLSIFTVFLIGFISIIGLYFTGHPAMIESTAKIKATINETVSFREIYDNYEIIDREGEIFTLIERETE